MTIQLTRRSSMLALLGAGAVAGAPLPAFAARSRADVERDRQSILAMAGDYRVRFDFNETTSFQTDYVPLEPKSSGGNEIVRVVTDEPGFIQLQHILVMSHDDQMFVIKHWRQDWTYEPRSVLTYTSRNTWTLSPVSRTERDGAWSQTVWQTDDSPRYGGVGVWRYDEGVADWTSRETLRPLARRDAVRNPPYDRYACINRHILTPAGWVHEQDNRKLGMRDGRLVTIVHEDGFNTYQRLTDFDATPGDRYWEATRDYWAGVRAAWDEAIVRGRGVTVEEEAQNGSITGPTLMGLADQIAEGAQQTAAALTEARATIATATA